jgi:pimeloyl-ACP methyl ester carboxylesterase
MPHQPVSPTTIAGFPALQAGGAGGGAPILFIHGAFAAHDTFAPWLSEMGRSGLRCLAAGRRTAGLREPQSVAGLRISDYVADTLLVIEALGQNPVVIGHSLGGLIAQKIAELGKCRAGVLLAPAPAGMLTAQPRSLPALLPMLPNILLGRPVRPTRRTAASIALNAVPVEDRQRVSDALGYESGLVYREMIFGTFRVDASKVRCPMLVMGGTEDRIVSGSLMRSTAQRYRADLKLYQGHGHWLMEEPGSDQLIADAVQWLRARLPESFAAT